MPQLQALVGVLNRRFSFPDIQGFSEQHRDTYSQGARLSDIARRLGTAPPQLQEAWGRLLDSLPFAIHETLRAIMHTALNQSPPTTVTFAWAPSYDFEVTVWQAPDTKTSRGGITVLLKSRYPDDRHPLG